MRAVGPLWLVVPGLLMLAVLLVVPVGRLLALSVLDPESGDLTTRFYTRMLGVGVYLRVLGITFRVAGLTAILSVVLGYPLAYWLAGRTEQSRNRWTLLVLVPFWTSYLVKTFAWTIILGRNGVLNAGLRSTGLVDQPLGLLNNEFGVMVGMVHAMLPLAVLTMLPVMLGVDRRLRPVAGTLGASPAEAFWLVYFPLAFPGVAAAGLLVFISALGFFIVPAILGGPQQTMLAQLIIAQIQEVLDWGFAGALSALILSAALLTCWVYDRAFGLSSLSGEVAARGHAGILRRAGLGALRGVALGFAEAENGLRVLGAGRHLGLLLPAYAGLAMAFLLVPILVIVPMGFTSSSFLDFPPPGYSLRWFAAYADSPVWVDATVRSFLVALSSACLATLVGGMAALGLARTRSRWRGVIFATFLAPMIVPRIVIAVGLFYLFAQVGLVGSDVGLVLGHALLALPFVLVVLAAVLKGYDWRLDQVAATLGASRGRTLRLVTIPLVKGGIAAAFLFAFITSFDELTIALFISAGANTTLPKQMWDDMILQLNPTLAAVSVVIFALITGFLLAAERFRRVR